MPRVRLQLHGEEAPTEVEIDWRAKPAGGTEFVLTPGPPPAQPLTGRITLDSPSEGLLHLPTRSLPFFVARAGGELQLWIDGETYRLVDAEASADRSHARAAGPAGGEVRAPMPGTVLKVLVRAGEAVPERAPLVVLESMKMELTLPAPAAGEVAEVTCEEGQLVDLGQLLVRLALGGA